MPPPGLRLSPSRNMAFHCTRLPSIMPWPCDMDGLPQISNPSVTAAAISPWNMHSHVPKEFFPASGTMKFVISRPTSSQKYVMKYVMKYASNRTCSQPCQTNCLELPPTHRMERGSTSRQTECGVGDLRRHFLMYESSTPTPPPTGIRHLPPATENTRGKRNEHTHRRYSKWSIRLSLHLFFFGHRRNGERQPVSTNVWLQFSLRSGITHKAPHSAG